MSAPVFTLGHFTLLPDEDESSTTRYAQCTHCKHDPFAYTGGTGSLTQHLKNKHPTQHASLKSNTGASDARSVQSDSSGAVSSKRSQSIMSLSSGTSSCILPPQKKQMLIFESLHAANNIHLTKATALFMASNHISHNVISTPSFIAFIAAVRSSTAALPTRKSIGVNITSLAAEMRANLWHRMKASKTPVAFAMDGWTNVQHVKVTNILLIVDGVAFYWCSITNKSNKNSADWLYTAIKPKMEELHTGGVRFAGWVADNEAVNSKLYRKLLVDYPFLLKIPCAAHTIQLIAKQVMESDRWKLVRDTMTEIFEHFTTSRDARMKLHNMQRDESFQYKIVKPNSTRWNSHLHAAQRLKKISGFVNICLKQPAIFWVELDEFIQFLIPFETATNIVQSDHSTLFDVLQQWSKLDKHAATIEDNQLRERFHTALRDRWHKQVNEGATIAAAMLSFEVDLAAAGISPARIDAARRYICLFGAEYLIFFKLSNMEKDVLEGKLMLQCGDLESRTNSFHLLTDDIRKTKAAAAAVENTTSWSALNVWRLYTMELSIIARALLTMPSSEAAVERSFSAQGAVHSKLRNRLHDRTVEDEMFVSFNHNGMNNIPHPRPAPKCSELSIDFMQPAEVESDAETEEDDSEHESVSESDDDSAVSEAESEHAAAVEVVMRSQSDINQANRAFLENYITENNITLRTKWTANRTMTLEGAALSNNPGGYSTKDLIRQINFLLKQSACQLCDLSMNVEH